MKMSDNMCVQNTETGFITNCRLCLNVSKFPVLSIFDEKLQDQDLARKIELLTNISIKPPREGLTTQQDPDHHSPPTTICIKCKSKVDAFLLWKETAWAVQGQLNVKMEEENQPRHRHHSPGPHPGPVHYRHRIRQSQVVKSEKLPAGHRSSNDSCIDEDYDSAACSSSSPSPRSASPLSRHHDVVPHHHMMSQEDESSQDSTLSHPSHHRDLAQLMEPVVKIEEGSVDCHPAGIDFGGGGGGELVIDSTSQSPPCTTDEEEENRLRYHHIQRHIQQQQQASPTSSPDLTKIQHFLNKGGANSILRSLISCELPIIRSNNCGTEPATVLTNRTNLPISPALPPFKLDEDGKPQQQLMVIHHENGSRSVVNTSSANNSCYNSATGTNSASYRRKQKNPTRNGHENVAGEGEDSGEAGTTGGRSQQQVSCALRSLPDEILSRKLPVPSSSTSSHHHTSTVIITPNSNNNSSSTSSSSAQLLSHHSPISSSGEQHVASSPSPSKRARKTNSMYPFNYLLEAIDFTSRQSSPENDHLMATSTGEVEIKEEEPESSTEHYMDHQQESANSIPHNNTHSSNQHQSVIEDRRQDQQQRHTPSSSSRSSSPNQHHNYHSGGSGGSRTQQHQQQDSNHHDYSAQQQQQQHNSSRSIPPSQHQVYSIKLNANLLSPSSHHQIPPAFTNGYFTGSVIDAKTGGAVTAASAEISLKNLLNSNQNAAPSPTILKKAPRVRSSTGGPYSGPALKINGCVINGGSLSRLESPRGSPSPSGAGSPQCMSPVPNGPPGVPMGSLLLQDGQECSSPRSSPKIRMTTTVMPVGPVGQIIPKRADLTCTNCNTKVTTIWRRYPSGEMVCNACGLYYRLHCRPRPVSMRRDNIHPRKRRPKNSSSGKHSSHHSSSSHPMLEPCDKSLSSGDESSSISLHSLISASFHSPFTTAGTSPPSSHHYALNLSPLCEDNLPLDLATSTSSTHHTEMAR